MRWLLAVGLVGCSVAPVVPIHEVTSTHSEGGPVAPADCAKGCSGPTPDDTHPLSDEAALAHFQGYAGQPVQAPSDDLETLLFHRDVSIALLDTLPDLLPTAHEAFLREQLARTRVEVAFRLVDEAGVVHGEAVRIGALKEKQHVVLAGTGSLKHIEVSGKTKRVGLHHLWSRW